jgi:hypothetical protein
MPELFQKAKLPAWSATPVDFVYFQRKALESPYVSRHLHHWISLIFSQNAHFIPKFSSHPRRPVLPRPPSLIPNPVIVQGQFSNLIYARIQCEELCSYSIFHLAKSGELFLSRFIFPKTAHSTDSLRPSQSDPIMSHTSERRKDILALDIDFARFNPRHRALIPNFFCNHSPNFFFSFGTSIVFISGEHSFFTVFEMSTGQRYDVPFHTTEILCIAGHENFLITGGCDSVLNVFMIEDLTKLTFSIPLYRDAIKVCCVHSGFGLIIGGTLDGFLFLCSSHRRSITRVISLDGFSPYGLSITEGFGFIVVFARKIAGNSMVFVFNVNGVLIRKVAVAGFATAWTSWVRNGFDFLLVAWDSGCLAVCEVFWLDFKEIERFRTIKTEIIAVRYVPEELGIVMLTASGVITFLPYRNME